MHNEPHDIVMVVKIVKKHFEEYIGTLNTSSDTKSLYYVCFWEELYPKETGLPIFAID